MNSAPPPSSVLMLREHDFFREHEYRRRGGQSSQRKREKLDKLGSFKFPCLGAQTSSRAPPSTSPPPAPTRLPHPLKPVSTVPPPKRHRDRASPSPLPQVHGLLPSVELGCCRNVYIVYGHLSHSDGQISRNKTDERNKRKKIG